MRNLLEMPHSIIPFLDGARAFAFAPFFILSKGEI
jgi:hypothetical protein